MRTLIVSIFLALTTGFFIGCDKNEGNSNPGPIVYPGQEICARYTGIDYDNCIKSFQTQTFPQSNHIWSSTDIRVTNRDKYEDFLFLNGNCSDFLNDCSGMNERVYVHMGANALEGEIFGTVQIYPLSDSDFWKIGNLYKPLLAGSHNYVSAAYGTVFEQGHVTLIIRANPLQANNLEVSLKFQGVEVASGTVYYCAYGLNCLY